MATEPGGKTGTRLSGTARDLPVETEMLLERLCGGPDYPGRPAGPAPCELLCGFVERRHDAKLMGRLDASDAVQKTQPKSRGASRTISALARALTS
jgi:hypothetical protein